MTRRPPKPGVQDQFVTRSRKPALFAWALEEADACSCRHARVLRELVRRRDNRGLERKTREQREGGVIDHQHQGATGPDS
jgi:hypothetical protein